MQLVRRAKPADAGPILARWSEHKDPVVRMAAVAGLRELGTNSGIETLKRMGEDAEQRVALSAKDSLDDLLPVLRGKMMLSVRTMDIYVEEHKFLEKQQGSKSAAIGESPADKLLEITRQIEEIVFSQLPLRRSFPDLFCEDCYSRAESLTYEEWEWVRCKVCHEVHGLKMGTVKIIGQIGGESNWMLDQGQLRVNLWDDLAHKARFGEVDILEIIGGKPINYDWAVNAVLEKIRNQNQGPANRISVKLSGNPALEVNTLHLLRSLDPGVMG